MCSTKQETRVPEKQVTQIWKNINVIFLHTIFHHVVGGAVL
jgi:hypothetical protein